MVELRWRGAVAPSLAGKLVPMAPGHCRSEEGAQLGSSGLGRGGTTQLTAAGFSAQSAGAAGCKAERGRRKEKGRREMGPGTPCLSVLGRLLARSFPAHAPFFPKI